LGHLVRLSKDMPADEAGRWLGPALSSPDAGVRHEAAEALGRLHGQAAIDAAVKLVGDSDPQVQREAIESLGRLLRSSDARAARSALPVFQKALQDEDPNVRRQLVETLGGLRSIADDVVPLLAKAAEDPDAGVQREAVEALGRISSPGAAVELYVEDLVENDMGDVPLHQRLEDLHGALADIEHYGRYPSTVTDRTDKQ
jgi:HEAT repeat protein